MYQVRRTTRATFDDLMRELEAIEQNMLRVDSALAMDLMVLEAKIREEYQMLEMKAGAGRDDEGLSVREDLTIDEIKALIPRDFPPFPTEEDLAVGYKRKRALETVGTAAFLAVATALGVFGLASLLQLALTWLA
jgi:hypothetical protein